MPNTHAQLTQLSLYLSLTLASTLSACTQTTVDPSRRGHATPQLAAAEHEAPECTRDRDCDGIDARCEPDAHVCTVRCPSLLIQAASDLAAARRCNEIDGELRIVVHEPLAIKASDLPYLSRVTGNIFSIGGQPLSEITLSALREVGTDAAPTLIEISLDGDNLRRVSLPQLEVVHGALSIFGLYALKELELPALESVDQLSLVNLQRLESISLPAGADIHTTEPLDFEYLCALPAESLDADGGVFKAVGCCTESAAECNNTSCHCDVAAADAARRS